MIGKLLGAAAMHRTFTSGHSLFKEILYTIAMFVLLSVIAGMVVGALFIAAFYAAYLGLLHFGLDPQAAQITITAIAALVVCVLVAGIYEQLHKLHDAPKQLLHLQSPIGTRVNSLVDAFIDGLMGENPPPRQHH
jgi:peptidoglycan/LPS O-acetylase OafA/YrhL